MKTFRAPLNERTKKISTFHRICTYENPTPNFESKELHGYEFTHIKSPPQQLVFHKEEIRLTPISLPTPPASPEVWGNSLHKWYQKKPLFTLTAKGQVKRIEKYMEIQKTLEMCKREYEIQKQTEDMKRAYLDFEFGEHQPLLYEVKDVPHEYLCSLRREEVSSAPVEHASSSQTNEKGYLKEEDLKQRLNRDNYPEPPKAPYSTPIVQSESDFSKRYAERQEERLGESVQEERIIKTKVMRGGAKDIDDRGIQKIIMKNKLDNSPKARYTMKLKNYGAEEDIYHLTEKFNFHDMPNKMDYRADSAVSKINVGNISKLPFDYEKVHRNSGRGYGYNNNCSSCRCHFANDNGFRLNQAVKFDINENEIS